MSRMGRAFYIQLAVLALAIAFLFFLSWLFPIVDLVEHAQQQVMRWGAWSAVAYPLLFALCNLLLLPGGMLGVGSGFFFGLWWGFLIVLVGNSLAAAVAFLLSRSVGRRWVGRRLAQSRTLKMLQPAVEREGWKIIGLSQLHPLFPASLLNYVYGLTTISLRTYILWATLGRAPGLFLYTYLGTLGQLGLNVARGKTHPRMVEYWTWTGAFVTSALLFVLLSRLAMQTLQSSPAKSPSDQEASEKIAV